MIPFPEIDPVAFQIGPLAIRWYGLSYVAAIGLIWLLLDRRAKRRGWTAEEVSDLVFYGALFCVLGGRLGYVLFYNLPSYLENPLEIFMVQHGGMSFHGGLLGLVFGCWWFARRTNTGFIDVLDFVVPAGPIGLMLGRIANFINSELWGAPTTLPWGIVFPDPNAGGVPRHPSQLYEAFLEGAVLFTILWIYSSKPRPTGAVTALFLLGYGSFRFAVEFVREPDGHLGYLAFGWVTMGQLLSMPMILVGLWLLFISYRNNRVA